ncbi:hypothetical protein T492DRAFT_905990 [Pavlovales sp. CCMP2436]|nr:hypothetical protein T492DRAFT_905990 [Pavlovales sp. CCMP2436]|mmetsp:Transcript_44071/g.109137  ORF Transcript_44071/g.109137 Transcript_44071/m.109137 type:complete len:408 (-) Transcript_44071:170-1393(-)
MQNGATSPLTSGRPVRWGILGTGRIARDFSAAIIASAGHELAAVAGRSPASAADFSRAYGGRPTIASGDCAYAELARAEDVDIVYIATVQLCHAEQILLCLAAGKHVLCEKPMCMNGAEARMVVAAARKAGRLLVEGHWTHGWPAAVEATRLVREGAIGELLSFHSDFSFPNVPLDPQDTHSQNEAGGGASLLVGVYPMSMALRTLGAPDSIHAFGTSARPTPHGAVDTSCQVSLSFNGGKQSAVVTYGWLGEGAQESVWVGTKGRVVLCNPAHAPTLIRLTLQAGKRGKYTTTEQNFPMPSHPLHLPPLTFPHSEGFVYEIKAVENALRAGQTECFIMPLDDSVQLAEAMDLIRKQLGISYDQDTRLHQLSAALGPWWQRAGLATLLGVAAATGLALGAALGRRAR